MSKPNLISFSTSAGFYRNEKTRELRKIIAKNIERTVPFCELAPMVFQMLMAYAAENQTNADFAGYGSDKWHDMFVCNFLPGVTLQEAALLRDALKQAGFLDADKIPSWGKFNRHLAEYEKIVKDRRKAQKSSVKFLTKKKQQEREAELAAKNAPAPVENVAALKPEPKSKSPLPNPVSRLISIRKLKENHPGRPNAANAPADPDQRSLEKRGYKMLCVEEERLNAEIAGVSKAA